MVKRRMAVIALLICLCFSLMPFSARAANTADAKEAIDPSKKCALTVTYRSGEISFSDLSVRVYRIAEVSADFQYTLMPSFTPSALILNGIKSNSEWKVIGNTLESYIISNKIEADYTAKTDEKGQICLEDLPTGLYFAISDVVVYGDVSCEFESALVSLPGLSDEGIWYYRVAITPKPVVLPPIEPDEEIVLEILKLWKGDENRTDRPKSVQIDIYRNGELYGTVTLSEENSWSYSWSAKNDGASWMVAEKDVPAGYSVTVDDRVTSFVVTNTYVPDEPIDPPQTGDTSNRLLIILIMIVSGSVLIMIGMKAKRVSL